MDVATESSEFVCNQCPNSFLKAKALKRHMRKSHFRTEGIEEEVLSDHEEQDTEEKNEEKHDCKYCEISFKKKTTLKLHIRDDHSDEDLSDESVKFDIKIDSVEKVNTECDICGIDYNIESELERHKNLRHSDNNEDQNVQLLEDQLLDEEEDGKTGCSLDEQVFTDPADLMEIQIEVGSEDIQLDGEAVFSENVEPDNDVTSVEQIELNLDPDCDEVVIDDASFEFLVKSLESGEDSDNIDDNEEEESLATRVKRRKGKKEKQSDKKVIQNKPKEQENTKTKKVSTKAEVVTLDDEDEMHFSEDDDPDFKPVGKGAKNETQPRRNSRRSSRSMNSMKEMSPKKAYSSVEITPVLSKTRKRTRSMYDESSPAKKDYTPKSTRSSTRSDNTKNKSHNGLNDNIANLLPRGTRISFKPVESLVDTQNKTLQNKKPNTRDEVTVIKTSQLKNSSSDISIIKEVSTPVSRRGSLQIRKTATSKLLTEYTPKSKSLKVSTPAAKPKQISTPIVKPQKVATPVPTKVPCNICKVILRSKEVLADHNNKFHTYKCDMCVDKFNDVKLLDEHKKTQHSCEICEDEFSWPAPGHNCFYTINNIRVY